MYSAPPKERTIYMTTNNIFATESDKDKNNNNIQPETKINGLNTYSNEFPEKSAESTESPFSHIMRCLVALLGSKADHVIQLMNFPLDELSKDENILIRDSLKKAVRFSELYRKNRTDYRYSAVQTSTSIIRYRDVSFIVAKPDRKITKNTIDGEAGIIVFTDGNLFDKLLKTWCFMCESKKDYINPRLFCDICQGYMGFAEFVLRANGFMWDKDKFRIHHSEHRRNNMSDTLMLVIPHEHYELHRIARANNHPDFNGINYLDYFRGILFETDEEMDSIENGLTLLATILPFFKAIDVYDTIDLRNNLTYMSYKEILDRITLY